MADKLKVDNSTLSYLAGISPHVFDLNSGQRIGRWEFTDPLTIDVTPHPFDPDYKVVTFTEEGKEPFKALVSTEDVQQIQQTVDQASPSMNVSQDAAAPLVQEMQGVEVRPTLEAVQPRRVFDDSSALPGYHSVIAEALPGGYIEVSVDGGDPQVFSTRFNDATMRAELEALGLDNWHINDIANMKHGDPPNVQQAYSVGELNVQGFNTFNDRVEAAVDQNKIDRAQDRVDQAVEMVADNLDVDGSLTVQRTGSFEFTITDQNGAEVQVAQMHLNTVLEENGHSSILAGVGFGKHQDSQPVVSHSLRLGLEDFEPGRITVPENDASLQLEQPSNDYADLRVRCPCGSFTWQDEGLLADARAPLAIEPVQSYLSAGFTQVGNTYNAEAALSALLPDATAAPVEPVAPAGPSQDASVQMAMDTTAPAFGGNGFA